MNNPPQIFEQLLQLAQEGDCDAQKEVGLMLLKGKLVQQDYKEACRWIRSAAEQGDSTAQNQLGEMYRQGLGVEVDNLEAVNWFRRAKNETPTNSPLNPKTPGVGETVIGLVVEIHFDPGISRPRVRPVSNSEAPMSMRVEFPRGLRDGRVEGCRFKINAKVAQKHHADGSANGLPYLVADRHSIVDLEQS